jgi:nucleotide-binding universal stress UspA family protein
MFTQHILFPTDGSENARRAQEQVQQMALAFKAKVTVLHAYEFQEAIPLYEAALIDIDQLEQTLEDAGRSIVDKVIQELTEAGVEASGKLINGKPSYAIVNTVEEEHCDLLIMGSRGLTTLQRLLLGSVSNYVIHHTHCPVMLIH